MKLDEAKEILESEGFELNEYCMKNADKIFSFIDKCKKLKV